MNKAPTRTVDAVPNVEMQKEKPVHGLKRWARPRWLTGAFCTSGLILLLFVVAGVFADLIAPHDPLIFFRGQQLEAPSPEHWLGTDELARDLFSRIVFGARTSMLIAISAVAISTSLGSTMGLVAGYYGGIVDMIIMRFADVMLSFPSMVLIIAVVAFLGNSITNLILVIGLLYTPGTARIMYTTVVSIKENEYVDAARMIGAPSLRIMLRHLLPNSIAPMLVHTALSMGFAILSESGLSFLGLGPPPPTPTWGQMVAVGRRYIHQQPWLLVTPIAAISLVIVSLNIMSDQLRDILDPRLKIR
jgi:peptide/nickel transport system permease protein